MGLPEGIKLSKTHHFISSDLVYSRFCNRTHNLGTSCISEYKETSRNKNESLTILVIFCNQDDENSYCEFFGLDPFLQLAIQMETQVLEQIH
jgi:hypothetical protein